jgi:hypothetical protein
MRHAGFRDSSVGNSRLRGEWRRSTPTSPLCAIGRI